MSNKKFALIAMVVGAIGVIIGGYTIVSITMLERENIRDVERIVGGAVDVSRASPLLGSKDAPITLIVFGDYQCSRCEEWYLNSRPVIEEKYVNTNNVNMYFLDFPFLGSDSLLAAEATYCAEEQGRYWEYHGILYENQRGIDTGWASRENLLKFASILGLDTEQFVKCLDYKKYEDRVLYNKSVGLDLDIKGTPTFLIIDNIDGGVIKIVGSQPVEAFEKVIDELKNT